MSVAPDINGHSGHRHQNSPATVPICPDCRNPMVLKGKKKILFTHGRANALYRCETCMIEATRTVKFP
jgi:hypothetical protein